MIRFDTVFIEFLARISGKIYWEIACSDLENHYADLKFLKQIWYIYTISHGYKPRMIKKICRICKREFIPDKYHPNQEVCSNPECQHKRQLENQRNWRLRNPDYFKYKRRKTAWEKKRAQYLKAWREAHKDYFKKRALQKKLIKQKLDLFLDKKE